MLFGPGVVVTVCCCLDMSKCRYGEVLTHVVSNDVVSSAVKA